MQVSELLHAPAVLPPGKNPGTINFNGLRYSTCCRESYVAVAAIYSARHLLVGPGVA
jgi:hypothetical protein